MPKVKYKTKACTACGETYSPSSGTQKQCLPCRTGTAPLPVCYCGSVISGPARWGQMWGGECDRAEKRASDLLDALARTKRPSALVAA